MSNNKKIKVAKHAGYCFGVKRAVEMVEELLDKKNGEKVFCHGSLIHNPQVISELEKKGFRVIDDPGKVSKGSIFVVRSHGYDPRVVEKIKVKGVEIVDATCPFVKKAQLTAQNFQKEGRQVVIFGDQQHAEVRGINAGIDDEGIVVDDIEEAEKLENFSKIGLLSQTTQKREPFDEVKKCLEEKFDDVAVANTICSATSTKQAEVKELAKQADVMIVVGGKSSSNTTKLYQLSKEKSKAFHVETAGELKGEWFDGVEMVGVAAGASTPQKAIDSVCARIGKLI